MLPARSLPLAPQTDLSLLINQELLVRLQILEYETNFCLAKDVPPLSRIYFAVPAANAACVAAPRRAAPHSTAFAVVTSLV